MIIGRSNLLFLKKCSKIFCYANKINNFPEKYNDKLELINPLLKRIIRILSKQGRIDIPKVNGREVKIAPRSPLAQAQHLQDVADVTRFNEIIAGTFGPQMINLIVDQNETAKY